MSHVEADLLLRRKTAEELTAALKVVDRMQTCDALSRSEATEWRSRIVAWLEFRQLNELSRAQ